MKVAAGWFSERAEHPIQLVRWGEVGTPVLLFPTAGGDAEEVERFGLVDAVGRLLAAGRIKVYSVDSFSGRSWMIGDDPRRPRWVRTVRGAGYAFVGAVDHEP